MTRTLNELWLSAQIYEQMVMQAQTVWVRDRLVGLLNRTEKALVSEIVETMATNRGSVWNKLTSLEKRINSIRSGAWGAVGDELTSRSVAIGYSDIKAMDRALNDLSPSPLSTAVPTKYFFESVATSRPFQGRLLKDWASKLQSDELARIRATLQTGLVSGQSVDQIVTAITGSRQLMGRNGVLQTSRNQLTTIVETAIQHIAANGRAKYAEDNAEMFEGERFTAVLDVNTTALCRSLDGNVYPLKVGPHPPLHFGCRSMRVPVLSKQYLQSAPLKRSVGKELLSEFTQQRGYSARIRSDLTMPQRREFDAWLPGRVARMVGNSVERQTFKEWLTAQPVSIQEEALGKAKAALFRKGGLALDKFVARDGREFTLAELVKRHRQAFVEAGLNPDTFEG